MLKNILAFLIISTAVLILPLGIWAIWDTCLGLKVFLSDLVLWFIFLILGNVVEQMPAK